MNITELIGDLKYYGTHVAEGAKATAMLNAADALKAQQVVIEQMWEALDKVTDAFLDTSGSRTSDESDAIDSVYAAIALQPSLDALREHDAEVVKAFVDALATYEKDPQWRQRNDPNQT